MTYKQFEIDWESDSDFLVCHTSGSTGIPKDILLPKVQMRDSARRTISYFNLNANSHIHSCISPDFIGGKMVLVRSKVCGCSFSWEEPSNQPLNNYAGPDIDLISVVPSQMIHILDNIDKMPLIRNFLIGGSHIPDGLRRRISDSGVNAYESYGMTETASHIALRKILQSQTPFRALDGIHVEDSDGKLKIQIEGWQEFVTNDCAEILNNKEFYVLGRVDNVIITGGKKINPEILEHQLSAIINFPFAISSVPDEKWGEKLVLAAVCNDDDLSTIRQIVDKRLTGAEKPKAVICLPQLPLTDNGKLKRPELRSILKKRDTTLM